MFQFSLFFSIYNDPISRWELNILLLRTLGSHWLRDRRGKCVNFFVWNEDLSSLSSFPPLQPFLVTLLFKHLLSTLDFFPPASLLYTFFPLCFSLDLEWLFLPAEIISDFLLGAHLLPPLPPHPTPPAPFTLTSPELTRFPLALLLLRSHLYHHNPLHYGQNVSPRISCVGFLKPSVVVVLGDWAFQSWSSHEGEALMHGIHARIQKPHRASSPLAPWEDTLRCLQPGRGPPPNHAGTLISDFWPPELWEINQFLSFIGSTVSGILLQQPTWMKHCLHATVRIWISWKPKAYSFNFYS